MRFLIILIFFSITKLFSYETNLKIISDILDNSSSAICDSILARNISELEVSFAETESSRLFEQIFFKKCSQNNIKLLTESNNKLFLSLSDISINYKIADNEDYCLRNIEVSNYAKLSLNNEIILISPVVKSHSDTVELEQIPELQAGNYSFTKVKIPEPKYSFYKKYLQPILISSAALVTVVLFFTIRSN